jgi:hypothetical protein
MGKNNATFPKCAARVMGNFKEVIYKKNISGSCILDKNNKPIQDGYRDIQKLRPCAKKASVVVHVKYSELFSYLRLESNLDDHFAFCDKCWERIRPQGLAAFNDGVFNRFMNGVRGVAKSVEVSDPSSVPTISDPKSRRLLRTKASIKKMMIQDNSRNITLDEWRQIFKEALEEHVIEGVLES